MDMLLIGEKFDFKQRTFPRGSHQNTKVLISQICLFFSYCVFPLRAESDYTDLIFNFFFISSFYQLKTVNQVK